MAHSYEQFFAGNKLSFIPKIYRGSLTDICLESNSGAYAIKGVTNGIHVIKLSNSEIFFDEELLSIKYSIGSGWGGLTWYVFNSHGEPNLGSSMRLYSLKMCTNRVDIRNFLPALDPTGKPCMYDTVTQQPFYNLDTGEFGYELLNGTYVAPVSTYCFPLLSRYLHLLYPLGNSPP